MQTWKTALQRGMVSGTTSSLLSTIALAALGKGEAGSMFAPTNAISHWLWGKRAFRHDRPSMRYTLAGYAIHHASATFWAVLFERAIGHKLQPDKPALLLPAATAASAVACFTDYHLTPKRLHPGYEERLSQPALAVVYGAFGLGLAAGAWLCRRR
jgi:hypothetical protein